MKKILLSILGLAVLVSCNKNGDTEGGPSINNVSLGEGGQVVDLNESFTIAGKAGAANLTYSYINYATPPTAGGNSYEAVSSISIRDVVIVTWHEKGALATEGAVSAYKYNTSTGKYNHTQTVLFSDAEYYEAVATLNSGTGRYEVFMAGQRDPDASGYVLNGHYGAVVTRLDYDYINDVWDLGSKKELPLPSSAGTNIAAVAGAYYITTGNGKGNFDVKDRFGNTISAPGGLYRVDYNLTNVAAAYSLEDAIAVEAHPGIAMPSGAFSVLWRENDGTTDGLFLEQDFAVTQADHNNGPTNYPFNAASLAKETSISYTAGTVTDINDERLDITYTTTGSAYNADSIVIAAGDAGMYLASNGATAQANHGFCYSTSYDPGARVLYYCSGEGGVSVLATDGYPGGALINTWDLVGKFAPPSNTTVGGTTLPSNFDIKEINVYQSNKLTLAGGIGGVYFMELN